MKSGRRNQLTRTVAAVVAYLLALVAMAALITRLAFQPAIQQLLRVHFVAVSHHADSALGIWLHNARFVTGFAVFLGCARLAQQDAHTARTERTILRACDGLLVAWATGTALLAGVLLGAYGSRQVRAFLPQGPVELLAWALLIGVYIGVRRQWLGALRAARLLAAVLAILAASAVLELWVGA